MPGWWYVISAETFLDFLTELPDIVELAPKIRCPALFTRGDKEPAHIYPAEAFAARAGASCKVEIIADCDHFYIGREAAVSDLIGTWLTRVTAPAGAA